MRSSCEFRRLLLCWLPYGAFFGLLCGNVPVTLAQASVTITVEDTHGKAVPNVKVIGRRLEKKNGEEEMVGELLTPSKSEGKTYTISGLPKGKYKFYACEPDLSHEPNDRDISLGDSEAKKFALILQEPPTTLRVDDRSLKPGSKVCLVHEVTGCSTVKVIESNGEIRSAGVRNHYRVEEADHCKD